MKKSFFLVFSILAIVGTHSLFSDNPSDFCKTAQVNNEHATSSKIASFTKVLKSFTRGNANSIRNMILFTIPVAVLAYNPEAEWRGVWELMRLWFGGYMLFETTPNTSAHERILLNLYKFFIITYAGKDMSVKNNFELDRLVLAGIFIKNMYESSEATATILDDLLQ